MGHRIKKIKDLSLLGLFFTLILLSDGQALSVTIVAQPMLDAKTPTQAISSDTSSKESVDTPTKASDEEKKENDSSTKIIVSSPVDEPVSISSSIHTQLVLSQLEHLGAARRTHPDEKALAALLNKVTCGVPCIYIESLLSRINLILPKALYLPGNWRIV